MDRYQIFKTLQDEDFFDTNLEPLRDAVAARLKHYKFHYQIDEDAITYSIPSIPSNKNRERRVFDIEDAKKFLECNLDDYSTIDGYKAIANLKTNRIECLLTSLVPITAQGLSSAIIKGRIYNPIKITHPDNNEIQISIEQVSRELCVAATCSHVNVSMSISGIELNTNARQILEKYSTSLFFQMDMLEVSSYALARETNPSPSTRKRKVRNARIYELKFPELDLESGPASLYWYGRAAAQMPLLRFLAYYQVAEFYFPRFSKKNAHQKIKNILKDPTFRAFKDSDIEKILKAIKVSGSGKLGDEKAQFATTLSDCIEANDLLNFVTQDEAHKNHFCGGKDGGLSRFKIPTNDNSQIYNAIANRLYEIRCKIVHTKDDHDEGGPTVLLPGSETAYTIGLDTSLMKFIAQRILINTSGEINI